MQGIANERLSLARFQEALQGGANFIRTRQHKPQTLSGSQVGSDRQGFGRL